VAALIVAPWRRREAASAEPPDDGGLREIVERATHAAKETPMPRARRRPPSRMLRTLIGIALYVAGLGSSESIRGASALTASDRHDA
jgi:hypothetical protein